MKKLYLILLALTALIATAANSPKYFYCDFSGNSSSLPSGWKTLGNGMIPARSMQSFFNKEGKGPYYIPMIAEDGTSRRAAFSNSNFEPSTQADEWLISPAIDIPEDNVVVSFKVYANGSNDDSEYEVYVSSTGSEKADFGTSPVYSGKITGSTSDIVSKPDGFTLSGYKDKSIYLAFVNKSTDCGFLGFSDIQVAQYMVYLENNTPASVNSRDAVEVSITATVIMPIENVAGFTAKLVADNGDESTYTTTESFGGQLKTVSFSFPQTLNITTVGTPINYTINVTPNFERALTDQTDYNIVCRLTYDPVCVVEEMTGTWCSYCTRGIAALNRFATEYPDNCFTIAIHGGETDPMRFASNNYLGYIGSILGNNFPNSTFNRKTKSATVADMSYVENQLKNRSNFKAEVLEVAFDPTVSEFATVTMQVRAGQNYSNRKMSVAAVVVEDGVHGSSTYYNQQNYYYTYDQRSIESAFGAGWWPYFQPLCNGKWPIPANEMTYNHVARGIYNSFYGNGDIISPDWKGDEPQTARLKFKLGANCSNVKNTSVIVLLIDSDGTIASAAKMKAENYVTESNYPEIPITGIAFEDDKKEIVIKSGDKINLYDNIVITPSNASNQNLKWKTSDSSIADVKYNGEITGGIPGTATITASATDDSYASATCKIIVQGVTAESLLLDPSDCSKYVGDAFTITPVFYPTNTTVKTLKWESSDESVATVSAAGLVTIVDEGTVTITATTTDGTDISASCSITALSVVAESLSLNPSECSKYVGDAFTITPVFYPTNTTVKTLEWKSSDEAVAIVNDSGVVTILDEGTAIVTATTTDSSELSATCSITATQKTVGSVDSAYANGFSVETKDNSIVISGLNYGDAFSIVAPDGKIIRKGIANADTVIAANLVSGTYLVVIAEYTTKVIVK